MHKYEGFVKLKLTDRAGGKTFPSPTEASAAALTVNGTNRQCDPDYSPACCCEAQMCAHYEASEGDKSDTSESS